MTEVKITTACTFKDAVQRAADAPLLAVDELREVVRHAEGGYQKALRHWLAAAMAIHDNLSRSDTDLREFHESLFTKEKFPFQPRENKGLAAVLLFVFNATTEERYNRCVKYAAGLQLLKDDGVAVEDIPAAIKQRGGIDGLYEAAKTKKTTSLGAEAAHPKLKTARGIQQADHEEVSGADTEAPDDVEDQLGTETEHERARHVDPFGEEGRLAARLATDAVGRGLQWLVVETVPKRFNVVLGTADKEVFWLKVKNCGRGSDGVVRLRAVKIAREAPAAAAFPGN